MTKNKSYTLGEICFIIVGIVAPFTLPIKVSPFSLIQLLCISFLCAYGSYNFYNKLKCVKD